jgi:hypothetical protein
MRRFRDWWQPPKKAGTGLEHHQVTFLELFYNPVYVVISFLLAQVFFCL